MQEVELEQHKHGQHPGDVGHPVQEVPILVVEQVHVEGYNFHLENHKKVYL